MADAFDVMDVLAASITAVVYPNGTSPANGSVADAQVSIGTGWPPSATVDEQLAAGNSMVSAFSIPGATNTTRYPTKQQRIGPSSQVTLGWTVSGTTATLAGTVATPQNVAIIVDDAAYAYAVQTGDTLGTIAAALATLIAADRPCTSSGATVSIPNSSVIVARVGAVSSVATEVGRQKGRFQITVWSPNPSQRRLIQSAIKTAFAQQHFITMQDGFAARLRYQTDWPTDTAQKTMLYRHDLIYEVEYATTVAGTAPQAIVWTVEVFGGVVPPTTNPEIYQF